MTRATKIEIGAAVGIRVGSVVVRGSIVEDLGEVHGRRLVSVRLGEDEASDWQWREVPLDELEPAPA